jgi:prepilin-type N-terminal cleavage/methylation domain-containing protein
MTRHSTIGDPASTPQGLRGEAGFTLIELLVAMSLMLVVLGAALSFLDTTRKLQRRDVEVGMVVTGGQTGFSRIVRDLRQAVCINNPAGSAANCPGALPLAANTNPIPCAAATAASCVSFKMRSVSAVDHHRLDVRYDCTASSACVRTANDNGVQTTTYVIPLRAGGAPLTNGGSRAAACSGTPVFTYYVRQSSTWTCTTTAASSTRIDLAATLAASGELGSVAGHTRSVLLQSSVDLRNIS